MILWTTVRPGVVCSHSSSDCVLQPVFYLHGHALTHSFHTHSLLTGQPCWYLLPEIGLKAINDSFILESCIYVVLKKYFRGLSCYTALLELFHEVCF